MNARKIVIFAIFIGFFIMVAHIEAAQLAGPNTKIPTQPSNVLKKVADVSTQQNVTASDQTKSIILTRLNVEVASDVYSEKDRAVLYCPEGNYIVVRNRIFLTGSDLDKVKQVKYLLHPSFANPVAVSEDPTNNFEVWIWSWGGFPIKATITTKGGQVFEKDFDFSFKSKFEEAQSKGIPQTMTCEE